MDGYDFEIASLNTIGLDGYVFTYNNVTGGNWTVNVPPVGNACAGTPYLGQIFVTPAYPAQYIGIDFGTPIEEKEEVSVGCSCKKCQEFNSLAEPNQEDKSFVCWACRHGY